MFCNQPCEEAPSTTLTEKGRRGINKASATRKDSICCVPGQQVHLQCRRKYCHPSEISKASNEAKQASSSSATEGHPTANLDILWKTPILIRFSRPSWSGMMQFVQRGKHPGMSSIRFLPMIHMNPSDATYIPGLPRELQYVLDGGALLQCIP